MKKEENKNGRIQKAVLYRTIIPMILMGILIAFVVFYGNQNSVRKEIENSLHAVAAATLGAYDQLSPGDYNVVKAEVEGAVSPITDVDGNVYDFYKGDKPLIQKYEIIDRIKKETGMDVTLFYQNVRVASTLKDSYGMRYTDKTEPTGIHAGVYSEVCASKEARCYQVVIEDVKYYACYLPIYNSDGTFVGMIATAVQQKEIVDSAIDASFPVIIITLIAVVFAGMISYSYTNHMADSILKVRKFLKAMVGGKLDNDMPNEVLKRDDELGDAGKAVVDMQNAIRILVERDPLTALYNRRYGGAKIRNIQKNANKYGMPYSICICDIDFFKKVNDNYGHDAGDVVLKRVADIMTKAMVGKGFTARWGGEEFLLIFDKMGMDDAVKELEKILDTIRATEIVYGKLIIKITMSFGIVNGDHSDDYSELLRHADERLYLAKMNGRNRIVSTDEVDDVLPETSVSKPGETGREETENKASEEKTEASHEDTENKDKSVTKSGENNSEKQSLEGDEEAEFLTKLLQKMNEQLYLKTVEDWDGEDKKDEK